MTSIGIRARFFEIKQAPLVRFIQHYRLADSTMEIQHVQTKCLGRLDLLGGQSGRRKNSRDGPKAPTDGCAHDNALAIEPEHGVAANIFRREPAEPKRLLHVVDLLAVFEQANFSD